MRSTAGSVGISLLPAQAVASGQGGRGCQGLIDLGRSVRGHEQQAVEVFEGAKKFCNGDVLFDVVATLDDEHIGLVQQHRAWLSVALTNSADTVNDILESHFSVVANMG